MEFTFEANPEDISAIGIESSYEIEEVSDEGLEFEPFDISGIDPLIPTEAKPGSEDKVKMLAARYAAGMPLWHDSDCYDHGPQDTGVLDALTGSTDSDDLDLDEELA